MLTRQSGTSFFVYQSSPGFRKILPSLLQPGRNIHLGSTLYRIVGLKNKETTLLITPFIMTEVSVSVEQHRVKGLVTIVLFAEELSHSTEFRELLSKHLADSQELQSA